MRHPEEMTLFQAQDAFRDSSGGRPNIRTPYRESSDVFPLPLPLLR